MITSPTVLVLGAGASIPFRFPSGQELKDEVIRMNQRNQQQFLLLDQLGSEPDEANAFRRALGKSGCTSVDAFLERRRPDFMDIGKAAIAITLLQTEVIANLFDNWIDRRCNPEDEEENWYDSLFGILTDGVKFEDLGQNKLFIITFNYDPSLEHYLFTALKKSYGKTDDQCAKALVNIPIVHVHGSLGFLERQLTTTSNLVVPYHADIYDNIDHVKQAAEQIKIIAEDEMETPEFSQARQLIQKAERLRRR